MPRLSIENFYKEHKEIYGNKVSKKSLVKSIEEILSIPNTKTTLYSGSKIYFTCNCTVKKINFGDLTFIIDRQEWMLRSRILLKSSMSKNRIKGRHRHHYIAPHCSLEYPPHKDLYSICLGGYWNPINYHFINFDYCGVVLCLQSLINNASENSHYFSTAVENLYKTCYVCDIIIKPFTLITQDNLKEKMLCNICKSS